MTTRDVYDAQDAIAARALVKFVYFLAALGLWLLAAGPPEEGAAQWIGGLLFHLLAAAAIRWLWIRPQRPKPRFASPWIFVIAAGVALLGRMGQRGV